MFELGGAWSWARELQVRALEPGGCAVDATLGGGGDAQALCELVGPQGIVYGFDIQPGAVERTRTRLEAAGLSARARLYCASHADMELYVTEPVDVIVFNLGWLPGGDHSITTHVGSTLDALNAALRLVKPGGLITVCAYPGHAEGACELEAVTNWASALDGRTYQAMVRRYLNQPLNAPVLVAITRTWRGSID